MLTIGVETNSPPSPVKSPLIRASHRFVRGNTPPGSCSPVSDDNHSPDAHLYERPQSIYGHTPKSQHQQQYGNHYSTVRTSTTHLHCDPHHTSYHHLNIPVTPGEHDTDHCHPLTSRSLATGQSSRQYQPHYARPPTREELEQLHQLTLPHRGVRQAHRTHRYELDFD